MRDLQRLEKLSSATALGFWAEDVILGIDRITRSGREREGDRNLLTEAANVLDDAVGRSEAPFAAVAPVKSIAATDTALGVAERLAAKEPPERVREILREVAEILREVADGKGDSADLTPAIEFFAAIGKHQLAEANAASGYSGGAGSWTVGPVTSSFS